MSIGGDRGHRKGISVVEVVIVDLCNMQSVASEAYMTFTMVGIHQSGEWFS
jgi:hypothetical protein